MALANVHGGQVGTAFAVVEASFTPDTAAYLAGDAWGLKITFPNAMRVNAGTAIVSNIEAIDSEGNEPAFDLVLFDTTFTETADNAVFAPSDADAANIMAVISVAAGNWSTYSLNSSAHRSGLGAGIHLTSGRDIEAQLVIREAKTYAASQTITIRLGLIQN